jgi:hypothetical protein
MSDWERRTRSREIAALRRRYAEHREALGKLMADAPTDRLAQSYARVRAEVEDAISKIDEIEGAAPGGLSPLGAAAIAASATEAPPPTHPALRGANDSRPGDDPLTIDQELLRDPVPEQNSRRMAPALVIAGILVLLLLLAFGLWRFMGREAPGRDRIVEETPVTPVEAIETATPEPPPSPLAFAPESFDFGVVAKGTRKAQRFTVTNNTDAPVAPRLGRSECRCLWFQNPELIAAGASGVVTITVDGARAAVGPLVETVQISDREKRDVTGTVEIRAQVE